MEVSRAVKETRRREMGLVFAIRFGNDARRRGEAQLRSPTARVNNRQAQRFIEPGFIQIEMQSGRRMIHQEGLHRFNRFPSPASWPVPFAGNSFRSGTSEKLRTDCNPACARNNAGGRARSASDSSLSSAR